MVVQDSTTVSVRSSVEKKLFRVEIFTGCLLLCSVIANFIQSLPKFVHNIWDPEVNVSYGLYAINQLYLRTLL